MIKNRFFNIILSIFLLFSACILGSACNNSEQDMRVSGDLWLYDTFTLGGTPYCVLTEEANTATVEIPFDGQWRQFMVRVDGPTGTLPDGISVRFQKCVLENGEIKNGLAGIKEKGEYELLIEVLEENAVIRPFNAFVTIKIV